MALYSKALLAKKTIADLRELVAAHDLEFDSEKPTKAEMTTALSGLTEEDAIVDIEVEDVEIDDVDEDEEDDEELEEDDEVDEREVDEEDEVVEEKKPRAKKSAAKKPAKEVDPNAEETLAAKQVASLLGTEAKTLRQFLRSDASTFEAVGSGGRYEFTQGDVANIKKEFDAWRAAHAARGSKRGPKGSTPSKPVEESEEVEEIEELDDEIDDELDDEDLELDE